jgi:hypothetical protein
MQYPGPDWATEFDGMRKAPAVINTVAANFNNQLLFICLTPF